MKLKYAWLLLVGVSLLFGSWYSTGGPRGEKVALEASTNPSVIKLQVKVPGFETKTVETELGTFVDMYAPGAGGSPEIGSPNIPVIRKMVEIPEGATVELRILKLKEGETALSHPIMPTQPPVPKVQGARVEFAYNDKVYAKNAFLPGIDARIADIVRIRGHRVALVEIYPFQYNPSTNTLRYAGEMEVSLLLKGSDMARTTSTIRRYYNRDFEKVLEKEIVNYGYFERGIKAPELPIGYLIIVADAYYNNVLPLAEWKTRKGFYTTVTKTSQIPGGATTDNIRDYIIDAYNNWPVPPTYVLLVGDVNTIPAFIGSETGSVTDLYYAAIDGDDYFPDLGVGRFSAENTDQVDVMVEKVVDYEKTDWTNGEEWIKKAVFMASSDNHNISEGTHRYVIQTFLDPHGYVSDSLWHYYGATTQQVIDALNDGRSLAIYSGHGSETSWADGPPFDQNNIRYDLNNLDMYPLVCSHACLTGDYGYSSECFGETWVRVADKGAIAFWGASTYSYWTEDDTLERAMFRALFAEDYTWLAGMMDRAKYAIYQAGFSRTLYYYQEYNLLGDPSMNLWTEMPIDLTVNYPAVIPVGPYDMAVSVYASGSPVEDALVALKTQDTLVTGYTNAAGQVTLHIETTQPESVLVTVTGYNLRPHLGAAQAIPSGAYVGYLKKEIDDSGGDGVINPGETVDMTVWLKNYGNDPANDVFAILSTNDPYISITTDSSYYGYFAPNDSSPGSNPYTFSVDLSTP
ncbi:MAG: hypothetical protein DRO93_13820, partial [Candidatus Thorarchaeota archaeon]